MATFLELYLRENPDARILSQAEEKDKEILVRAHEKKYIMLLRAPKGERVYTIEQLEQARMWKEKGCLDD